MTSENNSSPSDKLKAWPFVLIGIGIVFLWSLSGSLIYNIFGQAEGGTFGDMFGAINALFSGLAFLGIIIAIMLQKRELSLQRQELEDTRRVMEGQRHQLQAQNETLRRQQFENTFFQLLRLHNDLVSAIDISEYFSVQETNNITRIEERVIKRGRDCFKIFYEDLQTFYREVKDKNSDVHEMEHINSAYLRMFEIHQADMGHYFRNLYNIIKFIRNSSVNDRKLYTNLVRAQLSSYEHVLLFYNCLSELGHEKFNPLIEEYALLKNMPRKLLLTEDHAKLYHARAYGLR